MVESVSESIDPGFLKGAYNGIEEAANIDGDYGIVYGFFLDICLVGCSHELINQKKLNIIEDLDNSGSSNFAHFMKHKYWIEKPCLIISRSKPPSPDVLEAARKVLRILVTIEA